MMNECKEVLLKENELKNLCELLPKQGVLFLRGALASGKTTLVQKFAEFMGVKGEINSPTFSLMQIYTDQNGGKIYHYDIYQKGFEGILRNGLFENFFEEGLHLVEWGDENLQKALEKFGIVVRVLEIQVSQNEPSKRVYKLYE